MQNGDQTTRLKWRRFTDFSAAELYEMLRFRQAIFVVEQASPYPDVDGLDQGAQHLLLRVGGPLAAYLRLIPYPEEKCVAIGRIAVATAHRRRGLARLMLLEALARGRNDFAGCNVKVGAQTYLVPFYESLGFCTVSPPYDDYGVPHVEMALTPR